MSDKTKNADVEITAADVARASARARAREPINAATVETATFTDDVVVSETRRVRGSDAWFWSDEKPERETLVRRDYGESWNEHPDRPKKRWKVFELDLHNVTFEMRFGGDTVRRVVEYAFGKLVVLAQSRLRAKIVEIGDDAFAAALKRTDGVMIFETATAFEPATRGRTDGEKAASAVAKIDDEGELKKVEIALAEIKRKIHARRSAAPTR